MTGQDFEQENPVKLFVYLVAIILIGLSGMAAEVISAGWNRVFGRKSRDAFLQQ